MKKLLIGGVILATILIFAFLPLKASSQESIPQIVVDQNTKPVLVDGNGNTAPIPANVRTVTGDATYTMTLKYSDGSTKSFSEVSSFQPLQLPSGDISGGSTGKKITAIDFSARINRLDLPAKLDDVRSGADTESKVTVYLGSTPIRDQTFSKTGIQLATLAGAGSDLYAFSIPVSQISNVADGSYALSFQSDDKVKFYFADYTEKDLTISARHTFEFAKDADEIKAISVTTVKPTVGVVFEKVALNGSVSVLGKCPNGLPGQYVDCNVLQSKVIGYTTNIVFKAQHFKPLSPVTFSYIQPKTADGRYEYPASTTIVPLGTSKVKQSDLTGAVEDSYNDNSLGGLPSQTYYYSLYKISDGTTEVRGISGVNFYGANHYVYGPIEQDFLGGKYG